MSEVCPIWRTIPELVEQVRHVGDKRGNALPACSLARLDEIEKLHRESERRLALAVEALEEMLKHGAIIATALMFARRVLVEIRRAE